MRPSEFSTLPNESDSSTGGRQLNDATHRNEVGMYAVSVFMIIGALLIRAAIPGRLADR
jgi:hypothetical protein